MQDVNRFEDVLPGWFTRVRMTEARVRIDAPDWEAFLIAFADLFYTQGLVLLPLVLVSFWSWKVGLLIVLVGVLTARMHVTVTRGEVRMRRSVFFVPWSNATTHSSHALAISDSNALLLEIDAWGADDWGNLLVLKLRRSHQEEMRVIHAACRRLLA